MADSKITALTSIGTSTDPANDPLVIVDVSDTSMAASGTTKKVSLNNLLACSPTATLASATITGAATVTGAANLNGAVNLSTTGIPVVTLGSSASYGILTGSGTNAASIYINGATRPGFNSVLQFGAAEHQWYNSSLSSLIATLNTTGLGVGVVPSAARLEVGGQDGTQFYIRSTGTTPSKIRGFTNAAEAGVIGFLNGGGIYFDISGERMRIDSSGNVGISVTPSAWQSDFRALQVSSSGSYLTSYISGATINQWLFIGNNAFYDTVDSRWEYIRSKPSAQYIQFNNEHQWLRDTGTQTAGAACSFTQAMTLTASGNLLIGKTGENGTIGAGIIGQADGVIWSTMAASTSASNTLLVYSTGAAAYRFYVGLNGTINATNTTISAISDARFKENVQDIDVGLGAILALKPRKFDWKAGKGKDIKGDRGFIAQEFEQVFPQLVDDWADPAPEGEAPYKSVRQDLIPVLVKAIQELSAEVNALKNA